MWGEGGDYEATEVAIKLHRAKLCRAHKALQIVRLPEGNSIGVQRNKQTHAQARTPGSSLYFLFCCCCGLFGFFFLLTSMVQKDHMSTGKGY